MALRLGAVAGLTAVLAGLPIAGAAAATSSSYGPGSDDKVINLRSHLTSRTDLDLGEPGFDQGDEEVFTDDLFRGNVKVGHDGGVCTLLTLEPDGSSESQCVATFSLPRGQIAAQGLIRLSATGEADFDIAITGGTGEYRKARGHISGTFVNATDAELAIHLTG
ncbi:allene oxide cyclase barrel-like domain-containing protein [Streptomyces sp. SLBN-118]|uniref:allene oxide cyclase barrel-like domain-containing protein n=1 Tax=Streptomyces sp. SLBN-118 TaxID=2768454 RepID=UPI0021B314CA|nr:hypothetical protein [Streptomyces sp. SLBN-118]